MVGKERVQEVGGYAMKHGKQKASEAFNVGISTIERYMRECGADVVSTSNNTIMSRIRERYSDKELKMIAKGGTLLDRNLNTPHIDFEGQRIRIGGFTDPHLGSIYTEDWMMEKMFKEFEKEKVDFITCSGDITEGMSNRNGHVFECSEIGFDRQKDKAVEMLSMSPTPIFMISGNHDRWYIKNSGGDIAKDICKEVPQATFLGHDEGSIDLKGKAELRLWHGEDGNSYATSYRIQKVVESLTGGEKPNVMFFGHTHKQLYMYERMIHCYSMGSIQKQSKWMRGKRIAAHTGFWIIDIWVNDNGVAKIGGVWHPFYQ
jgi:predicted phosphodiesterase